MTFAFLAAALFFVTGAQPDVPNQEEHLIAPQDVQIVQDAERRWADKSNISIDEIKKYYDILVQYFPEKRCVTIAVRVPNVGGSPIYCYKYNGYTLTEKVDDVE